MCCVLSALLFVGPRAAILVWWLLNPARFTETFPNTLILIAGTLFLPSTTLIYTLVFPGGIFGLDWLWLGIGVLIDLSLYGGGAYSRRRRYT